MKLKNIIIIILALTILCFTITTPFYGIKGGLAASASLLFLLALIGVVFILPAYTILDSSKKIFSGFSNIKNIPSKFKTEGNKIPTVILIFSVLFILISIALIVLGVKCLIIYGPAILSNIQNHRTPLLPVIFFLMITAIIIGIIGFSVKIGVDLFYLKNSARKGVLFILLIWLFIGSITFLIILADYSNIIILILRFIVHVGIPLFGIFYFMKKTTIEMFK